MPRTKKAKVETTVDAPTVNAVGEDLNQNGKAPDYQLIEWGQLQPSPTNPRKRFDERTIETLSDSIRQQGILEPLIVRQKPRIFVGESLVPGRWYPMTDNGTPRPVIHGTGHGTTAEAEEEAATLRKFEIVCGERRYRAAPLGGVTMLPCLVRELTDDQVLDIQIHENLHREDVHPMDEAYGYKFLQEQLDCDITELALRVGKTESYILNRLKLNQLIPEAQKDIEDGFLPIGHALELAKFAPDSQLSILDQGVYETQGSFVGNDWVDTPIKSEPVRLAEFQDWIDKNVLWRLAKAPFDRKATNLRDDGLACTACPNRTGANAVLFDKEMAKKSNDSCLDPACWKKKAQTHVQLTRELLAHEASVAAEDIPLVDTSTYREEDGVLGYDNFVQLVDEKVESWQTRRSNKKCSSSIKTVDVNEKNYGQTIEICLPSSGCKMHFEKATSGASNGSKKNDPKAAEVERIKKLERKEELFDIAVGERVRQRVMRMAADEFASNAEGGDIEPLLPELLAKLWLTSNSGIDSSTKGHLIVPIMADATDSENGFGDFGWEQANVAESFSKLLSAAHQYRMLFLFIHGNTGAMYYDSYTSQAGVRELAEGYGINYTLLDAEERLAVAGEKAKKHLDEYKRYLNVVEAGGKNAIIPRPWASSYKPKD